ncbi:MAG: hypothetical protein R3B70_07920 [Polyangiaceae bacterium]
MFQQQEPDPDTVLGRLSLRARRVPAWIRGVLFGVAMLFVIACAAFDLPPYSTLVAIQSGTMDGEYYPFPTFLITFLVAVIPVGIAIQLLAGRYPEIQPPSPFGAAPFASQPFPQGPSPYNAQNPYWNAGYGGQSAPQGQAQPPQGQAQPPQGQQAYPQGQQPYPRGQQGYPRGQG